MIKLNIPVKVIPITVGIIFVSLFLIIPENMRISPMAFGRGGRPRFAAANASHREGINRVILLSPRLIDRFRVLFRS